MPFKMYGEPTGENGHEKTYRPSECTGTKKETIQGNPDQKHVSTSYAERHNFSMRIHMRRFTRLTNAFSKKFENHVHMVELYRALSNFARIQKTLKVTLAMAAGLTDTIWKMKDLVAVIHAAAPKLGKRGLNKKRKKAA